MTQQKVTSFFDQNSRLLILATLTFELKLPQLLKHYKYLIFVSRNCFLSKKEWYTLFTVRIFFSTSSQPGMKGKYPDAPKNFQKIRALFD